MSFGDNEGGIGEVNRIIHACENSGYWAFIYVYPDQKGTQIWQRRC